MAKNNSNLNGRALEFLIVEEFKSQLNVSLTKHAENDQNRDSSKIEELSEHNVEHFKKVSKNVVEWFKKHQIYSEGGDFLLHRLSDSDARNGDVTDISIINTKSKEKLNLSIKNNHNAVKHQRPGALPNQCGFSSTTKESITYKKDYRDITSNFTELCEELHNGATLFNEVKSSDKSFIDKNLYLPVCELVVNFINKNINASNVKDLFKFLVGNSDFIKISAYNDHLSITDYSSLKDTNGLVASLIGNSYVELKFDNGYVFNARLHTASSRLHGVSLKFDTQPVSLPNIQSDRYEI